jgi:hypothetical protein
MLTLEPTTATVSGGIVDRLGYCYCLSCWARTDRQANRSRAGGYPCFVEAASLSQDSCDGCGKLAEIWEPLVTYGTAVVEHVTCKIF